MGGRGGIRGFDRNRLRLLLASSSLAALLVGTGTRAAFAGSCLTQNGGSAASVSNAVAITCILIENNASVSGNVSNSGTITAGAGAGTKTGITVNNSTVGGAISNSGTITASAGYGIVVNNNATVLGGIVNATGGTIQSYGYGIYVDATSFFGGVTNSGTITSSNGSGIYLNSTLSTFAGGITNSGTISAALGYGIFVEAPNFAGGITNSGSIKSGDTGILVDSQTFSGGISNSGTITGANGIYIDVSSLTGTFTGNVTNSGSGTISAFAGDGINIGGSIFSGVVSNAGYISAHLGDGIIIDVASFNGGVSNSGTITAQNLGNPAAGIGVSFTTVFTGNITNSGTINASGNDYAIGIWLQVVSTFAGSIVNSSSGVINASTTIKGCGFGIRVVGGGGVSGGISNAGTINVTDGTGINVDIVSSLAGGIVNSGKITASTGGILVAAVTTFTGGISNSGTISAGIIGIYVAGVSTFSGNISNAGAITGNTGIKIGSGVTFAAGSGIVNSGTITGTGGTAIDVSGATSPVVIDQTGGTISGAIKLSANADVLNISGGTIAGNIVGQGSSDTINFNLGSGTFTYGASYGFSTINQVNINSGTVILNGTNSATNVDVLGGTLAGTGTLDPLTMTIHSGATYAPGNGTPGSFQSIVGNLVFQAGATYQIYLNPTTASYATITGAATVAGTVDANFASGSYSPKQYTILTATGGVSGTFTPTIVNTNLPSGMSDKLTYDADDVYLVLSMVTAPVGPTYSPLTVNQRDVAAALINYFNTTGGIPAQFFSLGPNALTQIDGEVATDAERGAFLEMDQFLELMLDPFVDGRSGAGWPLSGGTATAISFAPDREASLPPDIALAYAGVLKAPPKLTFDQRWTTWAAGFGASNTSNGDPAIGSTNVTASDYGYAAGMDYHYSRDTVFGFALAGGGTNWGLADGLGGGRSDDFHAGVYGVTRSGPWYLAGALAFANHWMSTSRIALGDQLTASFTAQSYGARVEGGYRYATAVNNVPIGITPYGALRVETFNAPGYSETDVTSGGFGLTYGAMNATDTRSELGARFDSPTMLGNMPLVLRAELAWAHDWVSNPSLNAAFETLAGTNFTVYGAPFAKNLALTTAGAVLRITPNWSFAAKFEGEFAGGSETYGGTGTLRYRW